MKMILAAPIIMVVVGVLLLFGGSAAASAEENVANSVGNFLQSKWLAIGLIVAGVLLYASEEGYLRKYLGGA